MERQKNQGLTEQEKKSYEQKTRSKKERWAKQGFSEAEQKQHSKYGNTVNVTYPTGDEKIYTSYYKASKDCGVDIQYCVKHKNGEYKGFKAVLLSKPEIDCNRWKNG